jgi:mannose-6-phosphate isomerase-like protein (cupin superfamily)
LQIILHVFYIRFSNFLGATNPASITVVATKWVRRGAILVVVLLGTLNQSPPFNILKKIVDHKIVHRFLNAEKGKKGKIEIVNFHESGIIIGRGTFEPGWSWDKCIKLIVKTDSCQAPHTLYIISGTIMVVMDDGTEVEGGPGDTAIIPTGHNAWIVGDEPCVMIDFTGAGYHVLYIEG